MQQNIVFAVATCTTADPTTGLLVRLNQGETWDADDPFVLGKPELFSTEPTRIRRTVANAPVESATRNPGEQRKTARGKK